jgi:hypothetical protein
MTALTLKRYSTALTYGQTGSGVRLMKSTTVRPAVS